LSRDIHIEVTPVFTKLWEALNNPDVRGIVLEGSSRSSKTWSICQAIIAYGQANPGINIIAARQKYTWVRLSILDSFGKVVNSTGMDLKLTKTPFSYKWGNGSKMHFVGLDDAQKYHGVETDLAWINEAIEAGNDDFDQIEQRQAEGGKWILDYNPSTDDHWIYTKLLKRSDVVYIHSTFRDNPFISTEAKNKILSYEPNEFNIEQGTADEFKWQVYGLGKRARREGVVFTNWSTCKAMPTDYQWECYGMDFGFTNDPSTLIRVVYADGQLWCEELFGETGMTNQDIGNRLKALGVTREHDIVADSAEPKSIKEIKLQGFRIRPSAKGQDSIRATIDLVQQYKVNILEGSEEFIKEMNNYVWQKDRALGKYKDKPIDDFNHRIDPLRYVAEYKLGKKNSGKYHVH